MTQEKVFYKCKTCGKILIERMPNGLFRFIFGKSDRSTRRPPVELMIHGNVKMRCLRCSCDAWNTFNLLPIPVDWDEKTQSD
jgi:DNA-directed RNA polymerase subunit RPC12/RpoP